MTTIATVKIPVRMPGANEYIAQERRSRYAGPSSSRSTPAWQLCTSDAPGLPE